MDKTSREFANKRAEDQKYLRSSFRIGFVEGYLDCVDQVLKEKDEEIERLKERDLIITEALTEVLICLPSVDVPDELMEKLDGLSKQITNEQE